MKFDILIETNLYIPLFFICTNGTYFKYLKKAERILSSKILQDIWILSESGIVVFSRVFNPKVNEQLFGALMTALNSFARELSSGGLTSFELSSIKFSLMKLNKFIIVANSAKKVKEKKVLDELKNVAEKFFSKYSDVLNDWDNDISVFSDFGTEIEDSLEETIRKFQKAFW